MKKKIMIEGYVHSSYSISNSVVGSFIWILFWLSLLSFFDRQEKKKRLQSHEMKQEKGQTET